MANGREEEDPNEEEKGDGEEESLSVVVSLFSFLLFFLLWWTTSGRKRRCDLSSVFPSLPPQQKGRKGGRGLSPPEPSLIELSPLLLCPTPSRIRGDGL